MSPKLRSSILLPIILVLSTTYEARTKEEGYLRYVKDGCFTKGEALSCIKYKALKLAKKTLFGNYNSNETIRANHMISFVPLDEESIREFEKDDVSMTIQPRGFFSEWTELTNYLVKLVKDFFKTKGLRVDLPDGARTIEDDAGVTESEEGRGRKKKLALLVPFLTLLSALKTKLLLLPILFGVLLIKKLLLAAALLIPSLLNTLKSCKVHHPSPMYSYFGGGSSDVADYNTGYSNNYAYSSSGGYPKDWASNRAYAVPKHRPTPAPVYITAPGAVA